MRLSTNSVFLIAAVAVSGCATYQAKWDEKITAPTAPSDAATTALTEGDAAWEARGDKAKLMEAITKWEAAFEKAPTADLAAQISRAHYLYGDGYLALEGNTEGRDAEYQKGLDWATRGLKLAAPEFAKSMAEGQTHAESIGKAPKDAIGPRYWYAPNRGKWAALKGFATRLRYKDDIKATIDLVKTYDEMYFFAAPWRYLGSYEAQTAGLAGGSLDKSEENYKKAVELAPNYLGTKVLWADFLCTKRQDKTTYEKLLKEVVAANAAAIPEIEPENLLEQEKAKKLLSQIDEKF